VLRDLATDDSALGEPQCQTLVGRLVKLVTSVGEEDRGWEELGQDLQKAGTKLQHLSRAGFGILATGIGKLGGVFGGGGASPGSRPLVIVFVIGGVTFQEVREVTEVMTACRTCGRTVEQVLLGSTTIATPELMQEQILSSALTVRA
jgi:bacterioferritin-associated ferredoxin